MEKQKCRVKKLMKQHIKQADSSEVFICLISYEESHSPHPYAIDLSYDIKKSKSSSYVLIGNGVFDATEFKQTTIDDAVDSFYNERQAIKQPRIDHITSALEELPTVLVQIVQDYALGPVLYFGNDTGILLS